jgi:4-hydroxybenzoate polyprenyltransferase
VPAPATTTVLQDAVRAPFSGLTFILQASRPGLWLTTIWFYLLPLGGRHVFHSAAFWLGLVYVCFPLGILLYGWNDCVDFEVDQRNPRKGSFLFGARGSLEQLRMLPARIALVQAPFLAAFCYLRGFRMLLWFAGTVAAAAIYNWPRFGFKSRPPLEILNQAGYLLVFLLSSWLNQAPQLAWPALVFGALFAMHSHVFGEIMDLEPDRDTGRRTTAVVIGRVPAKALIAAFLPAESALVFLFFRDATLSLFLLASGAWFLVDATLLWRGKPYSPPQMRFAMIAWNVIALVSMPWVWWKASLTALR